MPATHFRHGVSNLDREQAKILTNEMVKKSIAIAFDNTGGDTGLVLPGLRGVVISAAIDVTTAEATGTTKNVDIGIQGGAATAFATDLSTATIAMVGASNGVAYDLGDTVSLTFGSAHTEVVGVLYLDVLALEKILI